MQDGFHNAIIGYIKDQHDFVLANNDWWNPMTADKLFLRLEDIKKAMQYSMVPAVTQNPYWFCTFYNIIIHPLYQRERMEDLRNFTNFMNEFLLYFADQGKLSQGFLVESLIHTVGSHIRPMSLEGDYKNSYSTVGKLQEIGEESILKNVNGTVRGTTSHKKRVAKFRTYLELERGLAAMLEGELQDSNNHLWEALRYAKEAKWFPVMRQTRIFLGSVNRLMDRDKEARRIILDSIHEKRGFQPRRKVQECLELAKLSNDELTSLGNVLTAEDACKYYDITERVLLANVYHEKSKILARLGQTDRADEAATRAVMLRMEDSDERKLLIW